MNITKITLLDFDVNEFGEQVAKIEFKPYIGESQEPTIVVLRKGDSLTTDAPITEAASEKGDVKR